jgi:hypothetical protein
MRKIRSTTKKAMRHQKNTFLDSKEKIIRAGVAVAIVLVIIAVLMFLESGDGKLVIKNNTDLKLEYVKVTFVDAEGPINEGVNFENIEAKGSINTISGEHALLGRGANLEVRFKYENYDEIFTDAGIFNENFDGDIMINFDRTDKTDVVGLKVKAKTGLLSSQLINCDEEYTVNLTEGYVEE